MKIIITGQLKYYKHTIDYFNNLKIKNNASLIIVTEDVISLKDNSVIKINNEIIQKSGLQYDDLYIITADIKKKMTYDLKQIFNKLKPYYNKLDFNYIIRSLMRWKHLEYYFNNCFIERKEKILYIRTDRLLVSNKNNSIINNSIYNNINDLEYDVPILKNYENFRLSDYIMYGSIEQYKLFLKDFLYKYYGLFFSDIENMNKIYKNIPDNVINIETQYNQVIKKGIQNNTYFFLDIRDFQNELGSINIYYDKNNKYIYKTFGFTKSSTKYADYKINNKEIFSNFEGIERLEINESWWRVRNILKKKEWMYLEDGDYSTLLNYFNNNIEKYPQIYNLINNKTLELTTILPSNNYYVVLGDLHRQRWNNFKFLIKMFNIKVVFTTNVIPFWFLNLWEDLWKGEKHVPKLDIYPKAVYKPKNIYYDCNEIYKNVKKYDILIFGSIYPSVKCDNLTYNYLKQYLSKNNIINCTVYPFRKKLMTEILLDKSLEDLKIKIINTEEMYKSGIQPPRFIELHHLISQSKFTIVTCSSILYLVNKYFETALNNSIIIGNFPSYTPDIFIKNSIQIKSTMSNAEICNILINAVQNYEEHKQKLSLGQKLYSLRKLVNETNIKELKFIKLLTGRKFNTLEDFESILKYKYIYKYQDEY